MPVAREETKPEPAADRLRVLLLFGGRSSEHEVSCLSAANVRAALDDERHMVATVGITRSGRWTLMEAIPEAPEDGALPAVEDEGEGVTIVHSHKGPRLVRFAEDRGEIEELGPVDVCFPVLHGPYGEDGTVQGLLATAGVPYVGADVTSSAIGIDKRQMKQLFRACGLPLVAHLAVERERWARDSQAVIEEVEGTLPYPLFTKPSRQGSSVGIHCCRNREELKAGMDEAYGHDRVALVEEGLEGVREIECGVLGNADVEVTRPGELVHSGEFYDYDAKYRAPVELRCPAEVPEEISQRAMSYARDAYRAIGCRGMARVDFFYREEQELLLVNEINTIPGFTSASMFPAVWAAEGLSTSALVDRLLALALEAAQVEKRFAP